MRTTLFLALSALVIGCGGSSKKDSTTPTAETPAETPGAPAGDGAAPVAEKPAEPPPPPTEPAEVGPDIYKVALENESVRVFEVTFAPGAKIGMHKHPDHAFYVITGGKLKITGEDGKVQDFDLKAGTGAFLPAQSHSAENVGTTEIKLAVIEMRKKGSGPAPAGADPLKAAKGNYKKVFEDEHLRILEVTIKKGAKVKPHAHPDHTAFVLSAGKLKVMPAGADAMEMDMTPGQAIFIPASVHGAQNTGKTPVKAAIFEVK
jgi:beta-alanine degradation protein BauB